MEGKKRKEPCADEETSRSSSGVQRPQQNYRREEERGNKTAEVERKYSYGGEAATAKTKKQRQMEADEALARRLMREEAQEAERRKKRMEEEDERLARSLAKNESTSSSNAPKKEEKEEPEEKEGSTQTEKQRQSFVYEEKKGDLFVETEACLGHCVSEDLVMGKGIAKPFKDKFGGLSELRAQHPTTGGVCVLRRGGRFIYYLITKKVYRDKPTYAALQSSLEAMREHCTRHGVKQLALPRLGCGLDGLRWPNVSRILQKVFKDCPIHVRVYSL